MSNTSKNQLFWHTRIKKLGGSSDSILSRLVTELHSIHGGSSLRDCRQTEGSKMSISIISITFGARETNEWCCWGDGGGGGLGHSGMAEDLSRCRRRVMSQSGIIETRLWRQTRRDFRGWLSSRLPLFPKWHTYIYNRKKHGQCWDVYIYIRK